MNFGDDKEQGGWGTPPDETSAGATPADPAQPADPATPATPEVGPAPASPWQQSQPTGWGSPGQAGWGMPPAPQTPPVAPNTWPPQTPPPPAWQAGPSWQPQPGWGPGYGGMPPAGSGPRRPSQLPILLVAIAACLIAFSGGLLADHVAFIGSSSSTAGPIGAGASIQGSSLYDEAVQVVKQNYVGRDSLTDQQLLYGSIAGMVNSLGDTGHSEFLTAAQYAAMQSSLSDSIAGIGVILSDDNGAFKINRVIDGTPAAGAGVLAGDIITDVDGTSTASMTFDELGTKVRGNAGTSVTITVIHLGSSTPVDITMTRAKITVPLASWAIVPGTHVADISLAEFSTGAADQVQSDIDAAKAAGATSIVLDLRGNPGGYANEAQDVASEFLSSGTVYIQQDAAGNNTDLNVDSNRDHTNLPLVVLVDHDSASSSEIVAGALQDSARAKIVGVNTFGTGTVLQPFKLSDGSVIILGTEWWLTPNGHRIFGVGITPDQKVLLQGTAVPTDPADLTTMTTAQFSSSSDAQLLAAVADLTQ